MVERKQNCARLAASPASTVRNAFSPKSFQECVDVDRINVLDLKAHIVKRLGRKRANRYFAQFVAFISSRLSKPEFDKLVVVTIGKENVALHNQLVKAILRNTIQGRIPPPLPPSQWKHCTKFKSMHPSPSVTSNHTLRHTSPSTFSTGDSFLSSPRSPKSTPRHSRDRDYRVSPLGNSEAHSALTFSQPGQQLDVAAKQLDADSISSFEPSQKRERTKCPPVSDDSVSGVEFELTCVEESILYKEEREETLPLLPFGRCNKGTLEAPFHSESRDICWRPVLHAFPAQLLQQDGLDAEIECASELPDSGTMHSIIGQAAIEEGLEGASRECADILNFALDAYLRRLIKSCRAVGGTCTQGGLILPDVCKDNSVLDMDVHGGARTLQQGMKRVCMRAPSESIENILQGAQHPISLTDLKVAMDMNPCQLGGSWAVQLERLSLRISNQ